MPALGGAGFQAVGQLLRLAASIPMSTRPVLHQYTDPVDLIWLRVMEDLGWEVRRDDRAYATWDGAGTLFLATPATLDPDDSLAQLVFHEICHALIAGPAGLHERDWGLCNETDRDLVMEHACHRLQAALADPYGLRDFMAVTTDWRPYWDALPAEPLADGDDPAIELARAGHVRSERVPFARALTDGLRRTAQIADVVRAVAPGKNLWALTRERHLTGFLMSPRSDETCGGCAWFQATSSGQGHCVRRFRGDQLGPELAAEGRACERFESSFDAAECGRCGACCREGFDLVLVPAGDRFRRRHEALVVVSSLGSHLPRPGGRCPMLDGDGKSALFRCREYAERPHSCEDFPLRGEACLLARRRVGLSR